MNRIPVELIEEIFSFLNYTDLLNCKLVSKKFKFAAENKRLTSLFLFEDGLPSTKRDLDTYLNSMRQNAVLNCDLNAFLPKLYQNKLFSRLKQLCIYNELPECEGEALIHILNGLTNLECLEIISSFEIKNNCNLILSKTRSLSINLNIHPTCQLNLQSPKLEQLKINSINFVNIAHPETIKRLYLQEYAKQISSLVNLEYLNVAKFQKLMTLKCFQNLQKLQTIDLANLFSYYTELTFLKDVYARSNLKIFYYGINFKNQEIARNSFFVNSEIHSSNIKQFLEPKQMADQLYYTKTIELKAIFNNLDKLPANFLDRLVNVRSIYSSSFSTVSQNLPYGKSEADLLEFLARFPHLYLLNLNYRNLSSKFYTILPSLLPHLAEFVFNVNPNDPNLEFIFQFKQLKKLVILGFVPLSFVKTAFDKLNKLTELNFYYQRSEIENLVTIETGIGCSVKLVYKEIMLRFQDLEALYSYLNSEFESLISSRDLRKIKLNA